MKKYIGFILIMVLAVFVFGRVASAEEVSGSFTEVKPMSAELKQQIEAQKEALRDLAEAQKQALMGQAGLTKEEIATKKETFRVAFEAKKKEIKAAIAAEREAFKTKLEAQKAEFKAKVEQKRGEFRGKAKEVLSERFNAAVKNLTNAQTRVAAIIEKANAAGKDTAQAEVYLSDSKTKLADAQAKLAELKALVPTTDEKVTVEVWEQIKDGANVVKGLIKESHASLVEAVKVLKGLGKIEKPENADDQAENSSDDNSAQ